MRFATMQMNAVEISSQSAIDGEHKILIITDKCVLYAIYTIFIVGLEHNLISCFLRRTCMFKGKNDGFMQRATAGSDAVPSVHVKA